MEKTIEWVRVTLASEMWMNKNVFSEHHLENAFPNRLTLHTVAKKNNDMYPEGKYSPMCVQASANMCISVYEKEPTIHNYPACHS